MFILYQQFEISQDCNHDSELTWTYPAPGEQTPYGSDLNSFPRRAFSDWEVRDLVSDWPSTVAMAAPRR